MSDPHKDPTVKRPSDPEITPHPQEIPKLDDLKGVLGWVERKKEESKESGKPWGWVMGLLAAVVVFIALAFAAYTAWKKGREVAKLKHKIDVDEEKRKQAEANAEIAEFQGDRERLAHRASELHLEILATKSDIVKAELAREEAHSKIDRVSCWEDIDKL